MGAGSPLEAAARLAGPIPAGRWHLIGDGIVVDPTDITYEMVWRGGAGDVVLASVVHHFDPPPAGPDRYKAVRFETDVEGVAAEAASDDQLVFRFKATPAASPQPFIPNGDGFVANGRIPSIALPR